MINFRKALMAFVAGLLTISCFAQTNELRLDLGKTGKTVSSTMYGIFFEDINFAADGGLYAEMVKNRSFEFPNPLQGWRAAGQFEIRNDGPFERNPRYVRLKYSGHSEKYTALENDGFFGMGVKGGESYRFSVWARTPQGGAGHLSVELCNLDSNEEKQAFVSDKIAVNSTEWRKYQVILKPEKTYNHSTLRIFLDGDVTVDVEHVSLFPVDTWKEHENGLRKDLVQALYDLHPGIFRFPGGCIVEGATLDTRYNWKNSIGPVENRPLNENRWESTFRHRFFSDYHQTYGLGFYEFFQLCEELGAEPLPVVSCGLACQFQNHDLSAHQPLDEIDSFVQDALDLIEFANGPADSKWGKVRADMGHPAPFNMKYLAVGNEQWGEIYVDYLKPFVKALRARYPEIQIIGTSGPNSEGEQFDFLWPKMKEVGVDLVDEHYYRPEKWFLSQADRYDRYDRKGPMVFAGEYACHGAGKKWNHFEASLYEAAAMTGFERNADIVRMATYAPLFAHYEGWQWRPDLIWFDNFTTVRTASYYIQQLYSRYKGTDVLELTMNGKHLIGAEGQNGLYGTAVYDAKSNQVYVKIVNVGDQPQQLNLSLVKAFKKDAPRYLGSVFLHCDEMDAENTRENPRLIVPQYSFDTQAPGESVRLAITPKTFSVYIFGY
ncbi:MAG: alpha-L-arabinofuranosidase C-terminal domain-containing protein [Candidatus Cryptobacteroides sp.]|jgi:alpha-N-arabinofuranosidase